MMPKTNNDEQTLSRIINNLASGGKVSIHEAGFVLRSKNISVEIVGKAIKKLGRVTVNRPATVMYLQQFAFDGAQAFELRCKAFAVLKKFAYAGILDAKVAIEGLRKHLKEDDPIREELRFELKVLRPA